MGTTNTCKHCGEILQLHKKGSRQCPNPTGAKMQWKDTIFELEIEKEKMFDAEHQHEEMLKEQAHLKAEQEHEIQEINEEELEE